MPELPEVETVVRSLAPHLRGRRIVAASFSSRFVTPGNRKTLARRLADRTIQSIQRRGKFIVMQLDEGTLTVHLGMTGSLLLDAARHQTHLRNLYARQRLVDLHRLAPVRAHSLESRSVATRPGAARNRTSTNFRRA